MDKGAATREDQVRALFPLVKTIARRVRRMVPASDLDDLIGDGCVGLIRAVDSFDPSRGPTLIRYASRIIAGSMLNGVRRLDPVSERVRREIREAERERYATASERGELPSQHEMERRRPGLRRAGVHVYRYVPLSLDGPLPPGESLSGDWSADPAAIFGQRADHDSIHSALRALPERQRYIMQRYYFSGQSLHQIGRSLRVSPQRASQLHKAALERLRKMMYGAD